MKKSNKAKQTPSRTCADCFHFCACHLWAISISTDVAPQCPVFEPVRYRTLAELDDLRQMHKGDLAPVVHARWVPRGSDDYDAGMFYCSACKDERYFGDGVYTSEEAEKYAHFCPECGAKMDGGTNNAD